MKDLIPIIIRVLISLLFLVSAIAKLYPFEMMTGIDKGFVQGQLIPMGFPESIASYFSRFIIGIEFFIAFAILQKNYLRKIIIPSSIIKLIFFPIPHHYKTCKRSTQMCKMSNWTN